MKRHDDDVKHSVDKSFIVFESLFYTFTPFFIVREVLLKPVATQNLLVHRMNGMNIVHVQLSGIRYTRPLSITPKWCRMPSSIVRYALPLNLLCRVQYYMIFIQWDISNQELE